MGLLVKDNWFYLQAVLTLPRVTVIRVETPSFPTSHKPLVSKKAAQFIAVAGQLSNTLQLHFLS